MDFEITEEQEELRASVRSVLEQECPLTLMRDIVETGTLAAEPWKSATELGWPAIAIPESAGGLGLGYAELGLVAEEHGRVLAPGPFLATVTQFAPVVLEAGSAEQAERTLGRVAAGELTGALALASDSGSGLTPNSSLRARRDGDDYVLEGVRHFVLDGDVADEIVVVAHVDEGDGVGLFLVPQGAAKAERITSLDASRPLARLHFDGVRVSAEHTLGSPGASASALTRALEVASVNLALETVGTCTALLDLTVDYAKQRKQFDQPIGVFQAVQHKCSDMFVAVEKARATAYFALMTLAEDDPRRSIAASSAKSAAGDCQRLVCKEAIQIHGGIGFTWEADVHLYVKRAKTGDALLGTAAEHRARIADLLEI